MAEDASHLMGAAVLETGESMIRSKTYQAEGAAT